MANIAHRRPRDTSRWCCVRLKWLSMPNGRSPERNWPARFAISADRTGRSIGSNASAAALNGREAIHDGSASPDA